MLSIQVNNKKQNQRFEHSGGPLEFGRGPKRKLERFVVNDLFTSRDQLRIEERPGNRILAENLSQKQEIQLGDGEHLGVGASQELHLPVRLILGQTAIDIALVVEYGAVRLAECRSRCCQLVARSWRAHHRGRSAAVSDRSGR